VILDLDLQPKAIRANTIYIAGPMTGIQAHNFPAFNAAAEHLRDLAFIVINPADHGVIEGAEWDDYLRYDLKKLAECGLIYMLPGWSNSRGANLERNIAISLGMGVVYSPGAETAITNAWRSPEGLAAVPIIKSEAINTTKVCPECGSPMLSLFHSTNEKRCLDCHHQFPWPLDKGQKKLL
jgi:hypothetical protein